jgi:3-oxoisoapionate kinase
MSATTGRPLIGFYGDDFTGSSENLAQYHRHGLRGRLYLRLPDPARLAEDASRLDVVGLAGTARSLSPEDMEQELAPAFAALAALAPRLVQYKICSTFDSSPDFGSFGHAIAMARRFFPGCAVPVLAASPDFGRYTVFGQHFARLGNQVLRLDRHPGMMNHPRTPMREADLARHLAAQTAQAFDNAVFTDLRTAGRAKALARRAFDADAGLIFDALDNQDLRVVSQAIWTIAHERPVFALAAQGLAQSLGGILAERMDSASLQTVQTRVHPVDRLLVLSGSCAIQNARQIDEAERAGWKTVFFTPDLADGDPARACETLLPQVLPDLDAGRSVVVYSARHPEDRLPGVGVRPERLGAAYAAIAREVRRRLPLRRIVFAGGDSSSHALRALGADALEIAVFDEVQNSHVCRLVADDPAVDALEVMLKGGQIGRDDFLVRAKSGSAPSERMKPLLTEEQQRGGSDAS